MYPLWYWQPKLYVASLILVYWKQSNQCEFHCENLMGFIYHEMWIFFKKCISHIYSPEQFWINSVIWSNFTDYIETLFCIVMVRHGIKCVFVSLWVLVRYKTSLKSFTSTCSFNTNNKYKNLHFLVNSRVMIKYIKVVTFP